MADARAVWLIPYISLQTQYDRLLIKELQQSADSSRKAVRKLAGRSGIGAVVRREQLTAAEVALREVLRQMFQSIGATVLAGQQEASITALESGFDWDQDLLKNIYGSDKAKRAQMLKSLLATAPHNVDALIMRHRKGGLPLSAQVYNTAALADGWLNRTINSAIGRGANWKELQQDVLQFINPNTPGGASYAAKRLARTEINAAYHAVSIENSKDKPWVKTMTWNLSRSHPHTDICNLLAQSKYAPDDVPAKPHPQCFCYVTPDLLTQKIFIKNLQAGQYDQYIAAHYT